jgi:hypothetical protein
MAIPSRGIGWGTESNLLWQISKQISRLTSILFSLKETATPKYKVFTALLTQSGEDNPDGFGSGLLTVGVTYQITTSNLDTNFINVGAPNNNVGTYFIATGDTPDNWSGGYLSYNTGAPVATVLENTIGNVWFTYVDIGYYKLSSENLFTNLKSTSIMQTPTDCGDRSSPGLYTTYFDGESDFYISTFKVSDISAVPEYLLNTFIEIRVYN